MLLEKHDKNSSTTTPITPLTASSLSIINKDRKPLVVDHCGLLPFMCVCVLWVDYTNVSQFAQYNYNCIVHWEAEAFKYLYSGLFINFFFLLWRHTLCRLTHTCSFWPQLSFAISVCSSWIQCTEIRYNTRFNNLPYFTLALGESRLIIALMLSMWRPTSFEVLL